jgi:hypothetical protein
VNHSTEVESPSLAGIDFKHGFLSRGMIVGSLRIGRLGGVVGAEFPRRLHPQYQFGLWLTAATLRRSFERYKQKAPRA